MIQFRCVAVLAVVLFSAGLSGCDSKATAHKEVVMSPDSAAHCVAKGMPSRAAAIRQAKADTLIRN